MNLLFIDVCVGDWVGIDQVGSFLSSAVYGYTFCKNTLFELRGPKNVYILLNLKKSFLRY